MLSLEFSQTSDMLHDIWCVVYFCWLWVIYSLYLSRGDVHVEYFLVRKSWGFFFICFMLYAFCVHLCTSIFWAILMPAHIYCCTKFVCVCYSKFTAFLMCSVYIFSLNLCKVNFGKGPLNMICIWVEKSSVGLNT